METFITAAPASAAFLIPFETSVLYPEPAALSTFSENILALGATLTTLLADTLYPP